MYLFILCPPRQGSTILYKLLWTSPNVSTFFGKSDWAGEGQFVSGARKFFGTNRWSRNINWAGVKKAWDKCWDLSKPILCEKSPSNICRGRAIEEFFGQFAPVYFICMVQSPYARTSMKRWIRGARYQRENLENLTNVLRLTYEKLTDDLPRTIKRLLQFIPQLKELNPDVRNVPGINNRRRNQTIRNMNPNNTPEEIKRKNRELSQHLDLLKFHGYRLLNA